MMQIRLFWNAAVLAFFTAVTTLTPQAGRTAIVENIFEPGTQNLLGTISFPAISGNDAAGIDLSFALSGSFPPFTEADITSIHWELDPVNFSILDLFLNAFQGDDPCPNGVPCSNLQLQLFTEGEFSETGFQFSETGLFCTEAAECTISDLLPTDVEFRVAAIPEPGGFAILVVGLIGMGMVHWQRKRKGQMRPIYTVAD
jgi:hypothetical protein